MKEVNVTELRQKLPEYLARVQRGERVRVTSRGKPIADITPPAPAAAEEKAARARLLGSVKRYVRPTDPAIDPKDWEANR